jgi:regulator of sigma E protease
MVEAAETSASSLFSIFVIIAMNLGIFNLLPIPALDGGRILIILIELIIRRKISMKVQGVMNMVVFALLILLMLYVTFKDITSFFV